MSARKIPNISKINTKYLEQILNTHRIEGTTETGADYGHLLEEIESELFYRQTRKAELAQLEAERALSRSEAEKLNARLCTKCGTFYPLAEITLHFSKVSGKANHYRPACKTCHAKAAKERRELNKIEVPF